MTMFEELHALATSATLTMIVSADDKTGRMTVHVIPKPKKDVDEPALTKALSLTATPQEFDAVLRGDLEGADLLEAVREGNVEPPSTFAREIRLLARSISEPAQIGFSDIVGQNQAINNLIGHAQLIAATDAVVCIRGASGTGKELFARTLHAPRGRRVGARKQGDDRRQRDMAPPGPVQPFAPP